MSIPRVESLWCSQVTVVDPRGGELLRNQDVIIDQGRVAAIAPAGAQPPPAAARRVDGQGLFAVPGYNDMHVHALTDVELSAGLALMLANGITGFRQMAGTPQLWQQRAAGTLPLSTSTPALLAMPGELLTPLNAGSPEAAVKAVVEQKAAGVDFVKAVMASPTAFMAALEKCQELGVPLAGHLPEGADAAAAARAGMRAIEHMGPRDTVLLSCSTDEAALRQELARLPAPRALPAPRVRLPLLGWLVAAMMRNMVINPLVGMPPAALARMRRILDTYSEDKARQIAEVFATCGTWHVPTLIRARTMALGDAPEYLHDPNLRYVPPRVVQTWRKTAQKFTAAFSPEAKATLQRLYAHQVKLIPLFEAARVPMLAGSDEGGSGWVVPGFSLHQEFDELEKAGLSPLRVLQMTTLNPAQFLGRTAEMGTIEAGKQADIVLLQANPLDSVQNLHRIAGVIRAGVYHSGAALQAFLHTIEQQHGRLA